MKKLCRFAAKWWADACDGYVHHDNGERGVPENDLAMMLADMLNRPVNKEQKEAFVEHLSRKLEEELKKEESNSLYLLCDYSPCCILAEAANEVGVSINNFPFKTSMDIRKHDMTIWVSDGYGKPWEKIYDGREDTE